eukprot:s1350_g10.t1
MVIVQSYEPCPWNESAPGAPWGGQSTIWDACRDLMLAEKGRYDQPLHLKARRMHFELPQNSDRPGIRDPPRSATLRRMPQWPAPTFDSSAYKNLQMKLGPEPIPPLPTAYGRLDGDETQMPKAGPPSSREGRESRESREEEKADLPLELKWPGVRRVAWGDKPLEVGSQANSSSPRYAPFRYGAAIVRQQRGIHGMNATGTGPPSSRGSSRLQRSASQQSQSHSQQTQQQSQNSHPSHPSHRSLSHPSGRNSRSTGSGPKGSDSRSRDVDMPPIELIPPYYLTQRGESKNSARMQQKAFEHIAALSNV